MVPAIGDDEGARVVVAERQERQYLAPETLSEALAILDRYGEDAKLLAGGQSLLVLLRHGLIAPQYLVSLRRIPELATSSFVPSEGARLGAMMRQAELERLPIIRQHYTALAEAVATIATPQVRNQGTIGGNLCHADPTADPPAALIALGAQLEIAGLDRHRVQPVEDFFRDYMEVDLGNSEILTAILLPPPAPLSGSAYLKHRLRQTDAALVGVGAWVRFNEGGERIVDARIGLTGVGVTPVRAVTAEQVLRGAEPSDAVLTTAGEEAAAACAPFSDTAASERYRQEMVRVFVQRALRTALERAQAAVKQIGERG